MPERTDVRVLVTGTGGFVGHHLVSYLRQRGYWVRRSDLKYPEYIPVDADEFQLRDSRRWGLCLLPTDGVDHVYAFTAGMGGMGFIYSNRARGRTAGDLPVARAASQPPLSGPPTGIRTSTSSRSGSARLKMRRP
jgi:hypothetical protein